MAITDLTPIPSSSFVLQALAQSRATHPSQILDLVAGATDVRLYRVTVEFGNIGIHLTNSSAASRMRGAVAPAASKVAPSALEKH
jgi:spore maturation protein SpmB